MEQSQYRGPTVYGDFAKAFDKVPYWRLNNKLGPHGLDGRVLEWIKQYGKQRVLTNVMARNQDGGEVRNSTRFCTGATAIPRVHKGIESSLGMEVYG